MGVNAVQNRNYAVMVCLCAVFGTARPAVEQAWVTRSNANAQLLLNVQAKYSPESASRIGVDGYDEAIRDLSRDQSEPMMADLRKTVAEYQKRAAGESDTRVRQDLQILIASAQDSISSARLQRKSFIPYMDVAGLSSASAGARSIRPFRCSGSSRCWSGCRKAPALPGAIDRSPNWPGSARWSASGRIGATSCWDPIAASWNRRSMTSRPWWRASRTCWRRAS
jgi:hypothetical protein